MNRATRTYLAAASRGNAIVRPRPWCPVYRGGDRLPRKLKKRAPGLAALMRWDLRIAFEEHPAIVAMRGLISAFVAPVVWRRIAEARAARPEVRP